VLEKKEPGIGGRPGTFKVVILDIPESPLPTQVKMFLFSSQSKQKQEDAWLQNTEQIPC